MIQCLHRETPEEETIDTQEAEYIEEPLMSLEEGDPHPPQHNIVCRRRGQAAVMHVGYYRRYRSYYQTYSSTQDPVVQKLVQKLSENNLFQVYISFIARYIHTQTTQTVERLVA